MSWVFLIANVISLISNLGIEVYKRWKNRDKSDNDPIKPEDYIGKGGQQ